MADAAFGSVSFGKFVVREFVEDISQPPAERFFGEYRTSRAAASRGAPSNRRREITRLRPR
jgi:hypothetical protein